MHGWLGEIAACLGLYSAILMGAYLATPVIGRWLIAFVVLHAYRGFCSDTQSKMKEHLDSGRKMLIPAGQGIILGHLIEPYIEKLGQWMVDKVNEHGHDRVVSACTEACMRQLLKWRLTIALTAAHLVTGLIAIGFFLRVLFTYGAM